MYSVNNSNKHKLTQNQTTNTRTEFQRLTLAYVLKYSDIIFLIKRRCQQHVGPVNEISALPNKKTKKKKFI